MDTTHVWKRVAQGERTSALEAWTLLGQMLDDADRRRADPVTAIEEAAITVASALDRMDQRDTSRDTLLFELRSERGRCRELDALLVRMLDRDAADGIASIHAARAEVARIELAVRGSESAVVRRGESQVPPAAAPGRSRRRIARVGLGAIALVPVLLLVFKIASEERQRGDPTAAEAIEGAVIELLTPQQEAGRLRMAADWAARGIASSSSWGPLERAVGWPDIYLDPELDSGVVWSPRSEDGQTEWVEVGWNVDITAKTIVIVEGPNGGAIVAVDEIRGVDENRLGAADYVRLWSGAMASSPGPRFTLIHLPEARSLRGVRVVLDTSRIPGLNSLDAIGLIRE